MLNNVFKPKVHSVVSYPASVSTGSRLLDDPPLAKDATVVERFWPGGAFFRPEVQSL